MTGLMEIGLCFVLVLVCVGLSRWKKQNLEKDLLIGSLRTFIQLILVGHILNWIFKNSSLPVMLAIGVVMTINAAFHSRGRVQLKSRFLIVDNLVAITLAIWPLAFIGSALLHAKPVWNVEVFLPLLGMLLGNTLNGISVGVDYFGSELKSKREEVLSLLALGASKYEATSFMRNRALRIAMTPTLNAMVSMGIVTIPGMMTGQILAGAIPAKAAMTQIIIMFLITVGTYCGTYLALNRARSRKFNQEGIPCFE
jgi:putative ABC transport system permease protein